ncbi:methyltransferase domain-containing protein [bacterium]|nr:methyltransferase domain-containing protein [bacterium]
MSATPAKDFGPIADDYAFFEAHATEAEEDARVYVRRLAGVVPADGPVRLLDFGCGSGTFTARLLGVAGWPPARLRLTLVEPVDAARQQAVARLAGTTAHPVTAAAALPDGTAGGFDAVLANHSLYYVPELPVRVAALAGAVAPGGAFVTAVAPRANVLVGFWIAAFRTLGMEVPYHTSEDVAAALRAAGAGYETESVAYEWAFPDTAENRWRILRFLLADYLDRLAPGPLLALFDPYADTGRIRIHTASDHYTVRRPR